MTTIDHVATKPIEETRTICRDCAHLGAIDELGPHHLERTCQVTATTYQGRRAPLWEQSEDWLWDRTWVVVACPHYRRR